MRLSRDDAFRLASDFEEWIHEQCGEDITSIRQPDQFSVTVLRAKTRKSRPEAATVSPKATIE